MSQTDKKSVRERLAERQDDDALYEVRLAIASVNAKLDQLAHIDKVPDTLSQEVQGEDRDEKLGLRKTGADLTKSLTTETKQKLNYQAYGAGLEEDHIEIGKFARKLWASYMAHEESFKKEVVRSKGRDLLRMLPKLLAIIGIIVVASLAIVEIAKPEVLMPLIAWFSPSTDGCTAQATAQHSGNATAIDIATNACISNTNFLGYERIGLLVAGIALFLWLGIFLWRRSNR